MAETMQSRINSLQSGSVKERDFEKNDDPFSVADDVRNAVSALSAAGDEDEAESEYVDVVLRTGNKPKDALEQSMNWHAAAVHNPVQAARDLEDHYKALPKHALYRDAPKPPEFDDKVPEWKQMEQTIRWSAQQEERKEAARRAKAEAKPVMDKFRETYGADAAKVYRSTMQIHKEMSADPSGFAPRLPVSIAGYAAERQTEEQGVADAKTSIENFMERYPGANNERLRNEASKWLQGRPEGEAAHKAGVSDQRQLELAFAHAMGWRPKADRKSAEDDVTAAWAAYKDELPAEDDKPKRTYSEAERDVRKAVRQLMGE